MEEPTTTSYAGRTLVVILCMHRSGSSLAANLLQRLGMSLGPFELLGATEHNEYGHFEAVPRYRLDQNLLAQVFGFHEDVPDTAEVLRRFCECEGRWTFEMAGIDEQQMEEGRDFLRQLLASGPISGFKDPRVPLLWPFWERVLSDFDGLRVVPVLLARSPHEVAMSIFARSKGDIDYSDALDVTAVHYKRLNAISDSWRGEKAVVRFDPRFIADDLRAAAKVCGLAWSEEVFSQIYDASCRHQEPASVDHEAQSQYERLSGIARDAATNRKQFYADAAKRERLRSRLHDTQHAIETLESSAETYRGEVSECRRAIEHYEGEIVRYAELDRSSHERIRRLEHELSLIVGSRTWRYRQRLMDIRPMKWLADQRRRRAARREKPVVEACTPAPESRDRPCTIIIPVYNAFPEALACVRSVARTYQSR